jgi:hypothetical protein
MRQLSSMLRVFMLCTVILSITIKTIMLSVTILSVSKMTFVMVSVVMLIDVVPWSIQLFTIF